jgi:hypothetical protein
MRSRQPAVEQRVVGRCAPTTPQSMLPPGTSASIRSTAPRLGLAWAAAPRSTCTPRISEYFHLLQGRDWPGRATRSRGVNRASRAVRVEVVEAWIDGRGWFRTRDCTTVRPVLVVATIMTRTRPRGRRTSWIGARSPRPLPPAGRLDIAPDAQIASFTNLTGGPSVPRAEPGRSSRSSAARRSARAARSRATRSSKALRSTMRCSWDTARGS